MMPLEIIQIGVKSNGGTSECILSAMTRSGISKPPFVSLPSSSFAKATTLPGRASMLIEFSHPCGGLEIVPVFSCLVILLFSFTLPELNSVLNSTANTLRAVKKTNCQILQRIMRVRVHVFDGLPIPEGRARLHLLQPVTAQKSIEQNRTLSPVDEEQRHPR